MNIHTHGDLMKRALRDIFLNPLYVFLLVTLAYFSLRASNQEIIPISIQGHWVRISTNCGEPLKQEDLGKMRHSGDVLMPVRASLMLSDKTFEMIIYAGELCSAQGTIPSVTTMTDLQKLSCDPPQARDGAVTWSPGDQTLLFLAEEVEGEVLGQNSNAWGRTILSVDVKQRDGILQLSTEHRSFCPEGQKWNSYWVPFQGA